MKDTLTQSNKKYNLGLQYLSEHYSNYTKKLIAHLYTEHAYSEAKIAEILGVSRMAINLSYSKKQLKGRNHDA